MLAALLAFGMIGSGCAPTKKQEQKASEKQAEATVYPLTVTDDMGREVTIASKPEKIISIAPAITETLFAIGAGDRVVGVTSYDDYPEEVKDIEAVGDFSGPNLEVIASLNPDLVLLASGVQADVIEQLENLGATALVYYPESIDAVIKSVLTLGDVCDESEKAAEVAAKMEAVVKEVSEKSAEIDAKTAFIEIGMDPIFTVGKGTFLNELVEIAGGKNVVKEEQYVPYSAEQIVSADPQVYFVTSGMGTTKEDVLARPGFDKISAIANGNVFILEENLVSRPGPRIVEGLKLVQEALLNAK